MSQEIRVRMAPSPTGHLHVGTAQSVLYNWLFARQNKGQIFLRIEDTDKERSTKEYEESIIDSLIWLDLKWDGDPKRSSDNQPRYQELLAKLLKKGKAFYCHHTKEELETERKTQELNKEIPRHVCKHKYSAEGKKEGGIVRLFVDENSNRLISFKDQVRGHIEFKQALLGDFSIGRSATDALYHFAVVVDDIDMAITHVIRGEDHISNTPKHILIYEAMGYPVPLFAHLPLLLAPDRSKLSKRHGATAVVDYKNDYLPEALINFLGKLSYTFSSDIIDRETMLKEFELAKVHKSGAVFDVKKLDWINGEYIKKLSDDELAKKLEPHIGRVDKNYLSKILPLVRERINKFSDIKEFEFFFKDPEYDTGLLMWKLKSNKEVSASLTLVSKLLDSFDWGKFSRDNLRKELDSLASQTGDRGLVYWPFRVALTGQKTSPDPVDIAAILGKEKTLERVQNAISKLS